MKLRPNWSFLFLECFLACQLSFAADIVEIRNHHNLEYRGPLQLPVDPELEGTYVSGESRVCVKDGQMEGFILCDARDIIELRRSQNTETPEGPLQVQATDDGLRLVWNGQAIGTIALGMVTLPWDKDYPAVTKEADKPPLNPLANLKNPRKEDAVAAFEPRSLEWIQQDLTLRTTLPDSLHEVEVTLIPYHEGFLEINATVVRKKAGDLKQDHAYVALIMRVETDEVLTPSMRWNGIEQNSLEEPGLEDWHLNYHWSGGLDWYTWNSNELSWLWVNGLTPGNPRELSRRWTDMNYLVSQGKIEKTTDALYFLIELASSSPTEGTKWVHTPRTAPLRADKPLRVQMRLAIAKEPENDWGNIQQRVHAGYRMANASEDRLIVDLGVPHTEYGIGYSPYSTLLENLHYYRVPGLTKETWWPSSDDIWNNWARFKPQMQRDLRIIRWTGAEWIRLHHLEYLGSMDRQSCFAFMDWLTAECDSLGLDILIDNAGSPDWHAAIAERYQHVIKRVQVDNETLINGYKKKQVPRWQQVYDAIKEVAPETEVFWTGYGNTGIFDALDADKVPFDRLGIHRYVYGGGETSFLQSLVNMMGGVATYRRMPVSYPECNWKDETHRPPEERAERAVAMYRDILAPRALDSLYTFHFHETLCVNPMRSRLGIRHYEPFHMDRTPKPEVAELRNLVQQYAPENAPVRQLSIDVPNQLIKDEPVRAIAKITNISDRTMELSLQAECFNAGEYNSTLVPQIEVSPKNLILKPGETQSAEVMFALPGDALPGVRHVFIRANDTHGMDYMGWGIFRKEGQPIFRENAVLEEDKVYYIGGPDNLERLDWARDLTVAFRQPDFKPKIGQISPLEGTYTIGNTLQVVTGKPVYKSQLDDLSAERQKQDTIILIARDAHMPEWVEYPDNLPKNTGWITVQKHDGRPWLILGGSTHKAVFAAAAEFTLRYWLDSPYSMMSLVGSEQGAGYGDVKRIGEVYLP